MIEFLPSEISDSIRVLDLRVDEAGTPVPHIFRMANETLLDGGKKIRPALCFLMGGVLGVSSEKMAPYARAAELTHAASLAHDDVIDASDKRRNRATLNARASNSKAVLAGDFLLARVMVEISALGNVEVIQYLARVVEDLSIGELMQLEHRGDIRVDRVRIEQVARRKTASLMSWCCMVPALISYGSGQGRNELIESCRRFGEALGIGFQMIDDVVDFEPGGEKPFAQDLRDGLVNMVTYELMAEHSDLLPRIEAVLGQADPVWPWSQEQIEAARERVRALARKKLLEAHGELQKIVKYTGGFEDGQNGQSKSSVRAVQTLEGVLDYLGARCR